MCKCKKRVIVTLVVQKYTRPADIYCYTQMQILMAGVFLVATKYRFGTCVSANTVEEPNFFQRFRASRIRIVIHYLTLSQPVGQ